MFTNAQIGLPERKERLDEVQGGAGWIVIVYDNDKNTWPEVTGILQKATGCSLEEAEMETWEVHFTGRSVVHHGDHAECERAAGIIATIGIRVAVEPV